MNVLQAAKDTMELVDTLSGYWQNIPDVPESHSIAHLNYMLTQMEKDTMSVAKRCRWLGWMQAAAVSGLYPYVSMETMKKINKDNAEDTEKFDSAEEDG